jgi:ferredoxin
VSGAEGGSGMRVFKVHVDVDKCIGAGHCALRAPLVFDQREDGIVILLDATPPPALHAATRKAADLCPAEAIVIEESP